MSITPGKIRAAKVRVRAKDFANRLRSERWAETIPDADVEFLKTDEELAAYKQVLISKGCVQRPDFKWEAT